MNTKINKNFQERRSQTLLEYGFSKQPQLRSLAGRSSQLKYQLLSIPYKVVIEIRQKEGVCGGGIFHPCVTETKNDTFPDVSVKQMQSNYFLLI